MRDKARDIVRAAGGVVNVQGIAVVVVISLAPSNLDEKKQTRSYSSL